MLKKKARLTRLEFDHSFKTGKRFHSPSLQIIVSKSSTFHGSVVVGKKVFKKAVDRNKLRRRLYAQLYLFAAEASLQKTFIVVAKQPASKLSKIELKTEFLEALIKSSKLI